MLPNDYHYRLANPSVLSYNYHAFLVVRPLKIYSLSKFPAFNVLCLVTQSCPTLCDAVDYSLPGSSVPGDSPGKNTRVGCYDLFQGIFPTQGSNPGLTLQADSLPSEPPGQPPVYNTVLPASITTLPCTLDP